MVKLTGVNGKTIRINPRHIVYYEAQIPTCSEAQNPYVAITTTNGHYYVKTSVEEIDEILARCVC